MDVNHGSGTEIPIPVLADVDEHIPPPTAINGKRISQNIPTISVTKAPAPRPVKLPTAQDFVETPLNSFDEEGGDLEAGHGRGLSSSTSEDFPPSIPQEKQLSPTSRRPAHPPGITPVPHGVLDPLLEAVSPPVDSTTPLVQAMSDPLTDARSQPLAVGSATADTDLLADSARSSSETTSIKSSVESPSLVRAEFVVEEKKDDKSESEYEDESEEDDDEEEEEEEEEEEKDEEPPTSSIRLMSGSAPPLEPQSSEDSETVHVDSAVEIEKQKDADATSIKSIDSPSSAKQPQQGHKKTKSGLGGLRKFSGFMNKRTASAGSVKSIKEGQQQ
jgi:hypothetical protein